MMKKIFICYSHHDIEAKTDLEKFLRQYSMNNLLDFWSDEDLKVGDEWKEKIIQSINNSCAAILLVSVDFLISKFITEEEIPRIFKKKNDKEMDVFPLIVGHCDLESNENISKLQVRPFGATPLPLSGSKRKAILKDFAKEIKDLVNSNGVSDTKEEIDIINEKDDSNPVDNDINLNIIDQIHQYLTQAYKELSFVPIHLLTNKYPFKKEDSFYPYYGSFSVSSDNEQLTDFFKSFTINADSIIFNNKELIKDVKKVESKTKYVLNKLTNNLIFNIEDLNHVRTNIRYESAKECNCIRCRLLRFEYNEVFKLLKSKPRKLDELMKLAYVNYQIGNFLTSVELFKKALKIAEKEDKKITQFIIQHNLSKLMVFVRGWYWNDTKLINELKEINLTSLFCRLKNEENVAVLEWIYKGDFYSSSKDKIEDLTLKIKDHYYLQLNGGSSSNGHVGALINEHAKVEMFLHENYIVYDKFSEYKKLNEVLFEGLFASHAINNDEYSRLLYFDDWLLRRLMLYVKPDSILKYIKRYKLKSIKYNYTADNNNTFFEITKRILTNSEIDKKSFDKYCNKDNTFFWGDYNQIINNIILLYGIIEMNDEQVNESAKQLLTFLKESSYPQTAKYIRNFIGYKGKQLNKTILKEFIKVSLLNHKLNDEFFMEILCNTIEIHHETINLSIVDLNRFIKLSTEKCLHCKTKHSANILVHLYRIIDTPKAKNEVKKAIINLLSEKYDANLYFMASIYGVLKASTTDENFKQFLHLALPFKSKEGLFKPVKSPFSARKDKNSYLDMLINICFKYNINLKQDIFLKIKGINDYYDWLLDINGFNYDLFEPQWINEYPTKFYLEEFKKHKIIKVKLSEYFIDNRNPELERLYIELYSNKKNDVNS